MRIVHACGRCAHASGEDSARRVDDAMRLLSSMSADDACYDDEIHILNERLPCR